MVESKKEYFQDWWEVSVSTKLTLVVKYYQTLATTPKSCSTKMMKQIHFKNWLIVTCRQHCGPVPLPRNGANQHETILEIGEMSQERGTNFFFKFCWLQKRWGDEEKAGRAMPKRSNQQNPPDPSTDCYRSSYTEEEKLLTLNWKRCSLNAGIYIHFNCIHKEKWVELK